MQTSIFLAALDNAYPVGATDILVVDDQPEIVAMLSDALTDEGYHVRVAENGWAALRAAHDSPPGLILMDITMPIMSGDQALWRMRQQGLDVPVILMTADPEPGRFSSLDACMVLRKPFDLDLLLDSVAEQLRDAGAG